jgi:hypothetical protein
VIAITSRERRCDAWVAEMSRYAWRAAATIIIWPAPESRGPARALGTVSL